MKVSVIITSYNYENYIKGAIESVLNQSFQDFECIIIDDASGDSSPEIIESYANRDSRFKVIKNVVNRGLAKSLKIAVDAAEGEYIAFLESDDKWEPDYLERKLKIFDDHYDVGFVYNAVSLTGYYSKRSEDKFNQIMNWSAEQEYPRNMFYDFGYLNRILTLSSFMFRREYAARLDFKTPIDKLTDWYLYVQIAKITKGYYTPKALTIWHQHKDSYIFSKKHKKFKFVNICAYAKLWQKDPLNLKLFVFIIISIIRLLFRKIMSNECFSKG